MSGTEPPDKLALLLAEEVLRTIYGDDLTGCAVRLESIAAIIEDGLKQRLAQESDLLDVFERVVQAIHLLSTPPDKGKVTDPNELRSLLGDRLDAIRTLTTKTISTTSRLRKERSGDSPVES